jgi:hypothetical protein
MVALLGMVLFAASDGDAVSRSMYVPVEIRVCDHIRGAVLYRDDQVLRSLPGKQVFQFTFFPALNRIEPELERVRVEGEGFRTELIVTPATVYVGNRKIDLDISAQLGRLRRRVDARHETVKLTLRCPDACAREASTVPR